MGLGGRICKPLGYYETSLISNSWFQELLGTKWKTGNFGYVETLQLKKEMFNGLWGTYVIPVPLFINIPWQMSRYDTTIMGEIFNHQVNTSTKIKQMI